QRESLGSHAAILGGRKPVHMTGLGHDPVCG
ncbi:MAG: hypothetical protein ACI82F_002143, partial [Planctomycetota bacterium]